LGEEKAGKVSPWGKLHKCKLLFGFIQRFAGIVLNHLSVFPYMVAGFFL